MMSSQMVTVLQNSMCCLSTFLKATLLLYDIRYWCISWTSSWEHNCQWQLHSLFDWRGWGQSPCSL